MTEKTTLLSWDEEGADYAISHEDALIIRDALKEYKRKMAKENPSFHQGTIKDVNRIRRIFKVAEEGA
jgi:hypothetical protein